MYMRNKLLFLLVLNCNIFLSAQTFKIVFLADSQYAHNPKWITQIKKFGATGINYRIYRHLLQDDNQNINQTEWTKISNDLKLISDSSLDIYIRVNMFYTKNTWGYSSDDFQQTKNGVMYSPYYSANIPTLNLTSTKAFADRINFLDSLVAELAALPSTISGKIKLIVPTLSQDDETELMLNTKYPPIGKGGWGWLSGYSDCEQIGFMKFLQNRYKNPDNLNAVWKANFSAINTDNIKIKNYDWENIQDNYKFYPVGRKDFIDFLTSQLKRIIDTCAYIVHNKSFKIGVQFGSVYDASIEFKAFYDVTPLLEKVDIVFCDDVAEYTPNFNFAADYLRSVCNFWNQQRNRNGNKLGLLTFGTETNWPGYNHLAPDTLVKYWTMQLQSYYNGGATTLSISHWGTIDMLVQWNTNPVINYRIGDLIINDQLTDSKKSFISNSAYNDWKTTLNNYKSKNIKIIPFLPVESTIHLSPVKVLNSGTDLEKSTFHSHNVGITSGSISTYDGANYGRINLMEFPLYKYIKSQIPYSNDSVKNYRYNIVTDYMLENSH